MLERQLDELDGRYEELGSLMGAPEVAGDAARYREVTQRHAELEETALAWRELKRARGDLAATKALLEDADPDIREMAKAELQTLAPAVELLETHVRLLLLPKDPNDDRNVILEIRAGTGGDEASLFAADLFRMYGRHATIRGWTCEILSTSESEVGGFKEIIAQITGKKVYAELKYEAGVHRVQRIPTTETQGRIHTSTCTVAIMPEAEEVEVHIDPNDLRIDVYRSSGKGGQSVNTTDSAVRIVHLPTNTVVTCQDERSQLKNKSRAMKVLQARLLDAARTRANANEADERRSQVGTGDRSERIRTYNGPQNRLTDHRIGLTLYNLDEVIAGAALGEVVQSCARYFNAEALRHQEGSA